MKLNIALMITICLITILFTARKKEMERKVGFGVYKSENCDDVGKFPEYYMRIQTWAKANKFTLASSKSKNGKMQKKYLGAFKSIKELSIVISRSEVKGKEFIMWRVDIKKFGPAVNKSYTEMDELERCFNHLMGIKIED